MTERRNERPPRRKPLDPARQRGVRRAARGLASATPTPTSRCPRCCANAGSPAATPRSPPNSTYGTCRTRGLLDAVIGAAAGRPPRRIDPVLLDLLRLGTYQLLRTRVDAHAAVSTTVEQAGIEFDSARAGFVNGVLRTIAGRDEQSWVDELAPPADSDPVGHAAFVHAHPRWIAQAFADALGADAGRAGRAAGQRRRAPAGASRRAARRADRRRAGRDRSTARSAATRRTRCTCPAATPVGSTPVRDGAALVQDEGSQLVARALTLAAGRRRRRPLAGPVRRAGRQDRAAGRARRRRRAPGSPRSSPPRAAPTWSSRTPAACRSTCCASTAATPDSSRASTGCWSTRRAPGWVRCGARPEARWRRQPGDVPALAKLQRELLASAIALTRPGGVVLYATCSPHLAETVGVVADALRRHPVTRAGHPAAVRARSTTSATARTCSSGRTGTAPTPCSPPRCA